MKNLKDHWGWQGRGTSLKRESDDDVAEDNRKVICKDGTFKADSSDPKDSCDEFPFAKTKQSGGQLGLTGKDCAEIRPRKKNGQWQIDYINNVDASRRCTIGHVSLSPNQSVGGSLSSFYKHQRVLNGEKFWLSVR